jgi:hypothetical protein
MTKPKTAYYMKMSNGEDIVCEVLQDVREETAYVIAKPMKINYEFSAEQGRMFMGMSNWIPLMKSPSLVIYYDHVITIAEVDEEMLNFYHEALDKYGDDDMEFSSFEQDGLDEEQIMMANYLANTSTTLM